MGRTSDARERLIEAAIEKIWRGSFGEVTIAELCDRAKVNKGSFYYFFDSKPNLVAAAIGTWWEARRALLEKMFLGELPPLERIFAYIDSIARSQLQDYETSAYIRGAPIFRLGSEIAIHHEPLRLLICQFIKSHVQFFEEAIKEAQAGGQVAAGAAALKARLLWGYHVSTLTRAHIEQNPELIRNLSNDVRALINSPLFIPESGARKKAGAASPSPAFSDFERKPRGMEAGDKMELALPNLAMMGEYANLMIVLTDTQGKVHWANDYFVTTCGYSLPELRGQKPGALLQGPESDPAAIRTLHDAVHSAQPCACQITNYKKNGTPYPVYISVLPLFDEGIHRGFIAMEQDLSPVATKRKTTKKRALS